MSNMMRRAMMTMWLLVAACGSGAVGETDDVQFGSTEADVWIWEGDSAASDDSGEDTEWGDGEAPVEVGGFGWPCEDGGDCLSGFCVPAADGEGAFCTIECVEDCPGDTTCRLAPQTQPDPIFICLPAYPAPWCRPCRETGDCADLWADEVLDCHMVSPAEGSFCTRGCGEDGGCPQGFACLDGRCLPPGGCTCLEGLDAFGWETDCVKAGAVGECGGVRVCLEEGMSPCSAQQPIPEICNGLDDDCDGIVDPEDANGCDIWWQDGDGDGAGGEITACLCAGIPGYAQVTGDCDDGNPAISPSAPEVCNGLDDDCDGAVDEPPAVGCVIAWLDGDGDGWGGPEEACLCTPTHPYVAQGGDCDDQRADVYPGAPEVCDGVDQDCDGVEGDVCDLDTDGWCEGTSPTLGCTPGSINYGLCLAIAADKMLAWCPSGFGDCDDGDDTVYPGAEEVCDMKDNDCDGEADESMDVDGDGWCAVGAAACCPLGGGDCDDLADWIHPGAEDLPDPTLEDSNCDGLDGDISDAVFVHADFGHDYNPGNVLFPKETIEGAIEEAAYQGRSQVIVADAVYLEAISMVEGVGVYGRYTTGGGWHRHALGLHRASVISPDDMAVNAIDLGAATALVGLAIQAADTGSVGGASIAVFADNSPGLFLRDLSLSTGNAQNGNTGEDGVHGAAGADGEGGHKGCNVPGCLWGGTCGSAYPYGGGEQYQCSVGSCTCGGTGQNYVTFTQPEVSGLPYPWLQSQGGQHSCWYRIHGPGKGGEGGAKGVDGHKTGYDGQNGALGVNGPAGIAAPFGHMWNLGWTVGNGGSGWPGTRGYGGGGGGKGRNRDQDGLDCNTLGGEGGGGGEGGFAGSSGIGGIGGRSVIGILLRNAPIMIDGCVVHLGIAGNAGHGGYGGEGGIGGDGGEGGDGYKNSGAGGDGGGGGGRGHGGGGGGGRGGHAVGVIYNCDAMPEFVDLTVLGGIAGQGGQGGASGGNPGPDGQHGIKAHAHCID